MPLPEINAQLQIQARLALGHPWVYRNQAGGGERLRSGTWVRVRCGGFQAVGLWDATSPIAVRIFARREPPDATWFDERIWEAWELRTPLRSGETNAYRWIFGEGDGLPGLVVDRYGDYAVVQTYAESVATLLPQVVPALRRCDPTLRGVVLKHAAHEGRGPADDTGHENEVGGTAALAGAHPRSQGTLTQLWGERPPQGLVVQEQGLYFHADLEAGQKTGLFLDQRDNRATVGRLAGGLRVLNCFAYTGGFSLYALRGAASEVVSVDSGHGLAEATGANLVLNRLDAGRHRFHTEDCFTLLDTFARSGRRFDMAILDPPSFARAKANQYAAQRAYARINMLALRCIEEGGLLVSASCTSQVSPEAFRAALAEAAQRSGRRLQIIHEAGQPPDHPVPVAFPEGRYLKFVVCRVLGLP